MSLTLDELKRSNMDKIEYNKLEEDDTVKLENWDSNIVNKFNRLCS